MQEVNGLVTGITEFGKEIKRKLIDLEKNQAWLIERVKENTGLYFDDSYLHKIMTGKLSTPKIMSAINGILALQSSEQDPTLFAPKHENSA